MQFPFTLKKEADFDVVGFGTNAVDFLIEVPRYPEFNSKIELSNYSQAPGGEIATAMVGLQRLGMRTSYVGRFGTDHAGDIGISSLSREGVDLTYAEKIDAAQTQIAFIVIDERSGERTVIWKRDVRLHYNETDVPVGAVRSTKVLHFTPHDARACLRLAEAARANGTIVSIDVDNAFEDVELLLGSVDIIVASSDFPAKLFGAIDHRSALREMQHRFGAGIVGLTLGDAGSLLLCGDQFVETPAFEVPGGCKDTTGAGDSFRVGLIHGLITGETVERSARIANAVAALKCRAVGARTALPTPPELHDLLNND
ncbi:MAG TPA: carbohydrate kinase family protein [Pyrinomonadaceae bacterium]|nr:carbohydrate kinase family protein [Pyrinomonadaceae bacterium]